jgi:4-aminobutyrate aminotransferase
VFPLAALIARGDLDGAMPEKALGHYTHEKNPTACAAGLATIEVIEEEGLLEHARTLGDYALAQLRALMTKHPLVGDVRGLGLLMGVELVRDRRTMERAADEAERVMYSALSKGLNFKLTMGNIVTLTPALTITCEQMDRAISILDQALTEVEVR